MYHVMILREESGDIWHQNIKNEQEALEEVMLTAPDLVAHCMQQCNEKGAWSMVLTSTVNGTEMGDQEWHDALFLRNVIDPPDLLTNSDG